ncbi:MAG: hypothetical protein Q8N62_01585 [Candidatus Omnitrophota bacterium]|nr:hypothetical protein [Candidatus Omnitrophota bacterium]
MEKETLALIQVISENSSFKESILKTLLVAILSGTAVYYVPRLFKLIKHRSKPILTYHFNGDTYLELDKIRHSFGKKTVDKGASNGKAWEHTTDQIDGGATTCYGPYTKEIPFRGKYKARFRIKLCGIKDNNSHIITLDVAYGKLSADETKMQLGLLKTERHLRTADFIDGKYKDFDVEFEYDGESLVEFRCSVLSPFNFTNRVSRIFFDNVKVFLVSELI